MDNAYITGATGAIGMALVELLLKKEVNTTVFVRENSKRIKQFDVFEEEIKNGRLKIVFCALNELSALDAAKLINLNAHASAFFHLGWDGTFGASRNDTEIQEKNIIYTLDAVRLAKKIGCDTFVGAGSQAEYGRLSGKVSPNTQALPENEYGRCKLEAGEKSRALCRELHIRHKWARILSVYGPYDGDRTMIMSVISALFNKKNIELTKGIQTWDYIFSYDAANALYLISDSKRTDFKTYCIGSGIERQLRDYIEEIADCMRADRHLLQFGAVPYTDKQVMRLCADIHALVNDTGFEVTYSFRDGIRKTIDWYTSWQKDGNEEYNVGKEW